MFTRKNSTRSRQARAQARQALARIESQPSRKWTREDLAQLFTASQSLRQQAQPA